MLDTQNCTPEELEKELRKTKKGRIQIEQAKYDSFTKTMNSFHGLFHPILTNRHRNARRVMIDVATHLRTGRKLKSESTVIERSEKWNELKVSIGDKVIYDGKTTDVMEWAEASFGAYNASKALERLGVAVYSY